MKPLGLAKQELSRAGSFAGHFLLSPATLFPLAPEGPAAACCYYRAGVVDGRGLEVPTWSPSPGGSQRLALNTTISANK